MSKVSHAQVLVKVNAPVDEGIAEVVSLLSQIPGLETIESCQGDPSEDKQAYVLFYLGGWCEICTLVFDILAKTITPMMTGDEIFGVSVEVFNGSRPRGVMTFPPEASEKVVRGIRRVLPSI